MPVPIKMTKSINIYKCNFTPNDITLFESSIGAVDLREHLVEIKRAYEAKRHIKQYREFRQILLNRYFHRLNLNFLMLNISFSVCVFCVETKSSLECNEPSSKHTAEQHWHTPDFIWFRECTV